VVTNYNYGRFLGRCLRSLMAQSVDQSTFEIIVVDDASTDGSLSILQTFRESIRSIFNESNMGLSYSANAGISLARGRYVVRVDADDYVHQEFVRCLLLGFEFFGSETEAVSTDYLRVTPEGRVLEYGSAQTEPIACAIAFKIDALEALGFYDQTLRIDEEVDLRNRFQDKGFRIRNVNLPLYRYVQHAESLSKSVLL
jgi:glycosyltransferase involved in cell wall biosynthesis